MDFAGRLTEIMRARGVNKTQLGKAMGVTSQAAGAWANGENGPVVSKLPAIAEFLGVSVPDLVAPVGAPFPDGGAGDGEGHVKQTGQFVHESEEISRLIQLWNGMSISMREALITLAIAIARETKRSSDAA